MEPKGVWRYLPYTAFAYYPLKRNQWTAHESREWTVCFLTIWYNGALPELGNFIYFGCNGVQLHKRAHQPRSMGARRSEVQLKTTMPLPYLAPEIIDNIIDNLSDEPGALSNCSVVSKSWIPHARKHLFANIRFAGNADVQSWKLLFPNPPTSPGQFTRTLHLTSKTSFPSEATAVIDLAQAFERRITDRVGLIPALTIADAGTAVILAFSNVHSLEVDTSYYTNESTISLNPLHGFSSALTSLTITASCLRLEQMLNLALSFPSLGSLSLHQIGDGGKDHISVRRPETNPPFTGTLELSSLLYGIIKPVTDPLFEAGIEFRFQKVSLCCRVEETEVEALNAVLDRCSNTLKHLKVRFFGTSVCRSLPP